MKIEKIKILILLSFLLVSGCTMEGLNTAEVLEPGETSFGIGGRGFSAEEFSDDEFSDFYFIHPYLSFRKGFGHRREFGTEFEPDFLDTTNKDFGIRAYYPGLGADIRWQKLKDPLALAVGIGVGTVGYFPYFEIDGYLSKRFKFITPYLVCKGVAGFGWGFYSFIALGTQLSLCSTVDLLCEVDLFLFVPELGETPPLVSFMFNSHGPWKKW